MRQYTVEQLAREIAGQVDGDGSAVITGAAPLDKATPGDLSFVADQQNLRRLSSSRAAAVIVGPNERATIRAGGESGRTLIVVADPLDAFLAVLKTFRPLRERPAPGISPQAVIGASAVIGPGTSVAPGVVIDEGVVIGANCELHAGVTIGRDCRIGEGCVLYPRAVLYPDVILGDRVILHAGCVLGADGFGYRFRNGGFEKIPQLGYVRVEDDCEIGANATIDRGMIGPTVIGAGTKLDNLVMIGHNCELGKHNAFASQVGLAGSVITGDYVRCAGQVGVADHLHIGTGATIGAKSGLHRDVPAGETHVGYPARPEEESFKIVMSLTRVPEMRKTLRGLQAEVEQLKRQLEQIELRRAG